MVTCLLTPKGQVMRKRLTELIREMVLMEIPIDLAKREFEAIFLQELISRNGGNFSATAKQIGIHRNTLSRKVGQYPGSLGYHKMTSPDASADPVV